MRKSVERARTLRKRLSLPEGLLWREIRAAGNPVHLRRQHPIGGLTVDFACRESHLVFEINGEAFHVDHEDARRDTIIRAHGYSVSRIAAKEVLRDPTGIADGIIALCRERLREQNEEKG